MQEKASTYNEHHRGSGQTAYQRANLEDRNRDEVGVLEVVKGVDASPHQLASARRKEVPRTVPAHIGKRVKLLNNFGDCCGDDCGI